MSRSRRPAGLAASAAWGRLRPPLAVLAALASLVCLPAAAGAADTEPSVAPSPPAWAAAELDVAAALDDPLAGAFVEVAEDGRWIVTVPPDRASWPAELRELLVQRIAGALPPEVPGVHVQVAAPAAPASDPLSSPTLLPLDALDPVPSPPSSWSPPAAPRSPSGDPSVDGALSGQTVVISAGHGYKWFDSLNGWSTQRGDSYGLIEDFHNNEITYDFLVGELERMGARVHLVREILRGPEQHVVGTGDAGHAEVGSWSAGPGSWDGMPSRTSADAGASASFTWTTGSSTRYPLYVLHPLLNGVVAPVEWTLEGTDGLSETFSVDPSTHSNIWVRLGTAWLRAGETYTLTIEAAAEGGFAVAGARVGGGTGEWGWGHYPSGQPKWQECARVWANYLEAPSWVADRNDVTVRPGIAEWLGGDAYLSIHTNAGGGTGTSSFIHDTSPTAGSAALQDAIHPALVGAIRALWDSEWTDRGQKTANFGEVRELDTIPGTLIEIAFHDLEYPDNAYLHHPQFRADVARGLARGFVDYLAPGANVAPLPPANVAAYGDGAGGVTLHWELADDSAWGASPAGFRVHLSPDGKSLGPPIWESLDASARSALVAGAPGGEASVYRVVAWSDDGDSAPSWPAVATAADEPASVLIVEAFDRWGRYIQAHHNPRDHSVWTGQAIAAQVDGGVGWAFDTVRHDRVESGDVELGAYDLVVWLAGRESTDHETFSSAEQAAVRSFVEGGGALFTSGTEIGWDLGYLGDGPDLAFLEEVLAVAYESDGASDGSFAVSASPSGAWDGALAGSLALDDGSLDAYPVRYPDHFTPAGSQALLRYADTQGTAAVLRAAAAGAGAVITAGFPFEAVEPDRRAELMGLVLAELAPDATVDFTPPQTDDDDATTDDDDATPDDDDDDDATADDDDDDVTAGPDGDPPLVGASSRRALYSQDGRGCRGCGGGGSAALLPLLLPVGLLRRRPGRRDRSRH